MLQMTTSVTRMYVVGTQHVKTCQEPSSAPARTAMRAPSRNVQVSHSYKSIICRPHMLSF